MKTSARSRSLLFFPSLISADRKKVIHKSLPDFGTTFHSKILYNSTFKEGGQKSTRNQGNIWILIKVTSYWRQTKRNWTVVSLCHVDLYTEQFIDCWHLKLSKSSRSLPKMSRNSFGWLAYKKLWKSLDVGGDKAENIIRNIPQQESKAS